MYRYFGVCVCVGLCVFTLIRILTVDTAQRCFLMAMYIYTCTNICVRVYVRVCACVCVFTHMRILTADAAKRCSLTVMYIYTYTYKYTYTYTYIYRHFCV